MSEKSVSGAPEAHQLRSVAESFGGDPARYDRTRPPYPVEMIDAILRSLPGRRVLDVGCGTGIEARQFGSAGCDVLGVEPDSRMAEFARDTGVEVEESTFESWDADGRLFDAVIAGTAWHWVDPDVGPRKAAQVLRVRGRIAPFHHVFETPPSVAEAMSTAFREVAPDSPLGAGARRSGSALTMYQPLFDRIADGIRASRQFTEPERWDFEWTRQVSRAEWLDQIPTLGGMTQLDAAALNVVNDRVGAAIDTIGDSLTVPYTTVVVSATRNP
jgi:SAM-dependent methyltransferase